MLSGGNLYPHVPWPSQLCCSHAALWGSLSLICLAISYGNFVYTHTMLSGENQYLAMFWALPSVLGWSWALFSDIKIMSFEQDKSSFLLHAKIGKMVLCWCHGWRLTRCSQCVLIQASLTVLPCYPQSVTSILWSSFCHFFSLQARRRGKAILMHMIRFCFLEGRIVFYL